MSVDDVRAEALRGTVRGDRKDFGDSSRKEVFQISPTEL